MVLVCPCAALTEGLVSLYIVCMCVNCLNIYYINLIVSFFVFVLYFSVLLKIHMIINYNNKIIIISISLSIALLSFYW